MKKQKINVNLPIEQIIEEATTIAVWENVIPDNIEINSFHLQSHKVISAEGFITTNKGERHACYWNYQGICLEKDTLMVIEEGCL